MKKLTILLIALGTGLSALAQAPVRIKIHHQIKQDAFVMNDSTTNSLGHPFMFWKLTYYLSDISLWHDGGQQIDIDSTWFLIDVVDGTPTSLDLGNHNIQTLDSIRFAIGIAEEYNHLDPTTYPTGHPLAPQNPSMHWGWSAGYRFAVAEGFSGFFLDQPYEIHALGDRNFFPQTIETSGVMGNATLEIPLYADYSELMRSIDLTSSVISHGEVNAAAQLLTNFSLYVFTSEEGNGPALGMHEAPAALISVYPNPASESVYLSGLMDDDVAVIYSSMGEVIRSRQGSGEIDLSEFASGMYFVHVISEGGNKTILSLQKL